MPTREFLLGKLPPYRGIKTLVTTDQDTNDIINEMIAAHKLHKDDYDKISGYFWKGTVKDTCKFIFDFLKQNVKYSIEPDERQSVKSPAGILSTGYYKNGFNDCKHYSQFFSGILDSLKRKGKNIDWLYRFANYRIFTNEPQHVFVVASDGKNEFWCDPVLNNFDERKPYINKIDKKMSLYKISGISGANSFCGGSDQLQSIAGGIGRHKKSGGKKKGLFKKIHEKVRHNSMLVAMAPSRAAFILLVKLNMFKMVNKFAHALEKEPSKSKLLNIWYAIGGNKKFFEKLINHQYAHWKKRKHLKGVGRITPQQRKLNFINYFKRRFPRATDLQVQRAWMIHVKKMRMRRAMMPGHFHPYRKPLQVSGIGNPAALVAVLAAAVPVITALAAFMPKGAKGQADAAAAEVPPNVALQAAEAAGASANSITTVPPQYQSATTSNTLDENGSLNPFAKGSDPEEKEPGTPSNEGGFLSNMSNTTKILLAAGAAGALYFATKKK